MNEVKKQIWNCHSTFFLKFLCPQKWEALTTTQVPDVRYCGVCRENVFLCESADAFIEMGNQGKCVAIRKERTQEAVHEFTNMLGRPSIEHYQHALAGGKFWAQVNALRRHEAIAQYFYELSKKAYEAGTLDWLIVSLEKHATRVICIVDGNLQQADTIDIGCERLDEIIVQSIKDSCGLQIGPPTARLIRERLVSATADSGAEKITASGVSRAEGVLRKFDVPADVLLRNLGEPLTSTIESATRILESVPPDVRENIKRNGVLLVGEGSKSKAFEHYYSNALGFNCVSNASSGTRPLVVKFFDVMESVEKVRT